MAAPGTDALVGMHWAVHSFVVNSSRIDPDPFKEPVTFTKLFQCRPDKARFVVAQRVPMVPVVQPAPATTPSYVHAAPAGPFVLWDLYEKELVRGQRTASTGLIMPPPPLKTGDSPDGLAMWAMQVGFTLP